MVENITANQCFISLLRKNARQGGHGSVQQTEKWVAPA